MARVVMATALLTLVGVQPLSAEPVAPQPVYVTVLGGIGVIGGLVTSVAGFIGLAQSIDQGWGTTRIALSLGLVGLGGLVSAVASWVID